MFSVSGVFKYFPATLIRFCLSFLISHSQHCIKVIRRGEINYNRSVDTLTMSLYSISKLYCREEKSVCLNCCTTNSKTRNINEFVLRFSIDNRSYKELIFCCILSYICELNQLIVSLPQYSDAHASLRTNMHTLSHFFSEDKHKSKLLMFFCTALTFCCWQSDQRSLEYSSAQPSNEHFNLILFSVWVPLLQVNKRFCQHSQINYYRWNRVALVALLSI